MKSPDTFRGRPGLGLQLPLLPEQIVPTTRRPSPGTLAGKLLNMLEAGEVLHHVQFQQRTGSWRLAARVQELQELGWAIRAEYIPAPPSARCSGRIIARYFLPSAAGDHHHE